MPSRAFTFAALLGLVAALPGFLYVALSVGDMIANGSESAMLTNVAFFLGFGAIGPLPVVLSVVRMMRRPDRPVGLFVASLIMTSAPTLLLLGLATFAPSSSGGLLLLCLLGLLAGFAASVLAIIAAIRHRRARRPAI